MPNDETSLLTSVTAPASTGLSTSYTYFTSADPQDWERLETIQNMSGTIQLSNFGYTYKPVGTIATWTTQTGTTTAVLNTLSYDNADQLIQNIQSGGGTAGNQYNYDPAGNRLAGLTLNGTTVMATTAGVFNNLNQLIATGAGTTTTVSGTTNIGASTLTVNGTLASITGTVNFTTPIPTLTGTGVLNVLSIMATPSNGAPTATQRFGFTQTGTAPTALSYDLNGNTTTDENGNTYTWDALNRLTKITYPSSAYTTMAYDGLSRRTQIAEYNSSHTLTSAKNYLWVGSEMAEERDGSNNVTKRFFPQGEQQSGTNYYYSFDHLGSTREMTDGSGNIVARYDYDPYGRTTLVSGTDLATFQYAGMYRHRSSGLNLTWFRAYDPNTARWLGRDPLAESQGPNLYTYCDDSPVNFVDSFGASIIGKVIVNGVKWGQKALKVGVSKTAAADAVREGEDVIAKNQKTAAEIARDASEPGKEPIYEVDNATGNPHYHPNPRTGGHVTWSTADLGSAAGYFTVTHYADELKGAGYSDSFSGHVQSYADVIDLINPLSIFKDITDISDALVHPGGDNPKDGCP